MPGCEKSSPQPPRTAEMIALASPSSPASVIRSRQNSPANASGSLITSLLRRLSRKHVASAAKPLSVTGCLSRHCRVPCHEARKILAGTPSNIVVDGVDVLVREIRIFRHPPQLQYAVQHDFAERLSIRGKRRSTQIGSLPAA